MSHTKGKVELDHFAMVNITQNKNYIVTKEEHNDNARRIAALWNAAEDIGSTTKEIEDGVIQFAFELGERHAEVINAAKERIEKLEAEKSDMLEALEYAIVQVPELASVPGIESTIRKARGGE